ncbi:hypothetical protein [Streptomyces sp. NPDC017941]|uniref:hypothetical protein n=1 Tax=Streptomyces sp. NPDC017941 TaxID=3365018 RepID=UPI00379A6FAE
MRAGIPHEGASLLTLRVSRDGGRTYDGPGVLVVPHQGAAEDTDPLAELLADRGWPPCRCPLHRRAGG